MRPLRIELSGFLSFREPTVVDLESVAAAAIVGENGAGKTSLVEAIGWCLYGKGRFRSPDDYVSVGTNRAHVALIFEMAGQTYLVDRIRKSGTGARSDLSLFVADRDAEDKPGRVWNPVAGATIAETQAAIEAVVGLDYETWEATSYIAQGRADAFTQLTPAGRKALLGEVLELGRFDALHDAARARRVQEQAEAGAASAEAERLERIRDQRPGAELRAGEARVNVERLEGAVALSELALEGERRVLEAGLSEASDAEHVRARLQHLIARRDAAERQARERLEATRGRGDGLRARLEAQVATVARLRGSVELKPSLEASRAEALAGIQQHEQAAAAATERRQQFRAEFEREEAALRQAQGLAAEASDRIEHLARGDHSTCFTCGQPLSRELRDEVTRGLVQVEEQSRQRARTHQETIAALSDAARDVGREQEAASLAAEQGHRQLAEIERGIERTTADQEREVAERRHQEELTEEIGLWEQEVGRLSRELAEAGADAAAEEAELRARLESASAAERAVNEARAREADVRQRLAQERGDLELAIAAAAVADQDLAQVTAGDELLEAIETELAERTERVRLWDVLVRMFGRDGLPTLVIENAVPEIEAAANRWLAKLAAGRLSVRIESLRANKGGGIRETLDVIVSDGADERPLEGFSGGERQRVNLALRLALSELLAARAGHRIQALVLDEAFTALDAQGRQLAIEVTRALEDTFDLTLFVTHLTDMAEAFPVRLQVSRDETSRVEVVPA